MSQQVASNIQRLELNLFELQQRSLDTQFKLLKHKTLPKFSLFLQTGLGRPALNQLSNDFEGYYIGGLKLNWNISSFFTQKKEGGLLRINQSKITSQRETFLFNTNQTLIQQGAEIQKIQELIRSDREIVLMREKIKTTTQNQLENGTATTTDYLTQVNAEEQAKQNLILHQIQLLLAQYNYQITSGN